MAESVEQLFENVIDLPPADAPLDKSALPSGGGVYAFVDAAGGVIQTIGTQALRRSIAFRLEPPDDEKRRRRADIRAIARRICWTRTYSTFETSLAYLHVARRLLPKTYRKQLAFGPVWFARVNLEDCFPRWVSDTVAFRGGVDVGPFSDSGRCAAFIELLEDLFELCRKYEILTRAPNGQPCVYFEMGKCPAPCDGSVSLDEYRATIRESLDFACGAPERKLSDLDQEMKRASSELAFERAAHVKTMIGRARKILANDGRLVPVPQEFRYLIVQRAAGRARVKPFFVDQGEILAGEPVRLKDVGEAAQEWSDKMANLRVSDTLTPACRSEHIWLVSHFVHKGDKAPGLFLHASRLGAAESTAQRIVERFGGRGPRSENHADADPAGADIDSFGG